MSKLSKAIALAATVHDGQTDKGGEPYILHALHVMRTADTRMMFANGAHLAEAWAELIQIVGVLHDVVEDFDGNEPERNELIAVIEYEFGPIVWEALKALTHEPSEPYLESYIERVAQNEIARRVKLADLTHNMDPTRLPEGDIGDREFKRWDKYRKAVVRLKRGKPVT